MIKKLDCVDIVISIYNQEGLILYVLESIFKNTTSPFNLILVFDGCTDRSEYIATEYIKENKIKYPNFRKLITTDAPNVYETRANNIGFKLAKENYLITVQDDMIIEEMGWEKRLTYPIRKYDDIFAVTSRTAMNINFDKDAILPKYKDMAQRESFSVRRNSFEIRSCVNRGPIAFRNDMLRKLNYLADEFAPAQLDEADLVLRAYEQFKMKSGSFYILYNSDISWSKTAGKDTSMNTRKTLEKNCILLKDRHPQLCRPELNIIESRTINDHKIDYSIRDNFIIRIIKNLNSDKRFLIRQISRKKYALKIRFKRLFSKIWA